MRLRPRLTAAFAAAAGLGLVLAPAADATPVATKSSTHRVVGVIDGDTVKLANGATVRLIGFDTPERGKCGYATATKRLKTLVLNKKVKLTNPTSVSDKDKYGRALRSISVGGKDVGLTLIGAGLANARYDKLDGYQKHPLQTKYRSLDKKVKHKCGSAVDKQGEKKAKAKPKATGKEPWNKPGPDLDCGDIRKKVRITGTDYHRLDADGDGWGCESYG